MEGTRPRHAIRSRNNALRYATRYARLVATTTTAST